MSNAADKTNKMRTENQSLDLAMRRSLMPLISAVLIEEYRRKSN